MGTGHDPLLLQTLKLSLWLLHLHRPHIFPRMLGLRVLCSGNLEPSSRAWAVKVGSNQSDLSLGAGGSRSCELDRILYYATTMGIPEIDVSKAGGLGRWRIGLACETV